ncbi:MAG: hypothetical protein ACRC11_11400 [Xenococcaceae cyanobacterium]
MIRFFKKSEFDLKVKPIFNQVFLYDNAFYEPFSPSIVKRTIIYPCNSWVESPLIDAIISIAQSLGDNACYFSELPISSYFPPYSAEIYSKCPNEPSKDLEMTAYFSLDEFLRIYTGKEEKDGDERANLKINICPIEFALYSATGKWGVMISEEHFGILGGSIEFIAQIRLKIPDLELQVYEFLDYLSALIGGTKIKPPEVTRNKWLLPLLNHVYGQEKAEEILTFFREEYVSPEENINLR